MIVRGEQVPLAEKHLFWEEINSSLLISEGQSKAVRQCLTSGLCLLCRDRSGRVVGGVGYHHVPMPDDDGYCLVERMLYVTPVRRGGSIAAALLDALELEARSMECKAVFAGSSLGHHKEAQRLYEEAGFTTNLTFRKDLPCAIQSHSP